MVKIKPDMQDNPYFTKIGSLISNYPCHCQKESKIKDTFVDGDKVIHYRIVNYDKRSNVLSLVSTHSTDRFGVSRVCVNKVDLSNGFWWYDVEKDILTEVDKLFEKFLFENI